MSDLVALRTSNGPRIAAAGSILLVGYEDRDNLGLRYLLSSLRLAGATADIARYSSDPTSLVERCLRERPMLIGFSMIFQYMAPDFGRVIAALRAAGIDAHITVGGHYPSFDYDEVLGGLPGLDSVVRFEGEHTLVELAAAVASGREWRGIAGIAWRDGDEVHANPLRAPLHDLDTLPPPDRASYDYEAERLPTAAILGSRGCPWDCTFCSIRPFYEAQGGALRRFRKPAEVVAEMAALYHERRVELFLFQDDDFLAGGRKARAWACEIADAVVDAGLAGKIAWKISCRSDEIHAETMVRLMRGGLTHVYMGVEAGDADDLADMRKRITADTHLEAGRILREVGLSFDFGFMLLQPYSTFARIRNSIDFLERFVGDGYAVAGFCRMLPYAGTPIKDRLVAEGRLLGTPFQPDYRFLDPRLDVFYDWMVTTFHRRNFTDQGLNHVFRAALFEARARLDSNQLPPFVRDLVQYLAAVCNKLAFYVLREGLDWIEAASPHELRADAPYLRRLAQHEASEEDRILGELAELYERWFRAAPEVQTRFSDIRPIGSFERTWTFEGDDARA
ncbi:MAG TPA: radical SAM protein [Nannocystaceae bacterium]|nr:radical SAM protein [Nannocystaceae bacterium]